MAIWKLSQEDKDKLLGESRAKEAELKALQGKSWQDLWAADLDTFSKALIAKEDSDKKDLDRCLDNAVKKLVNIKGDKGLGRVKNDKRLSKGLMASLLKNVFECLMLNTLGERLKTTITLISMLPRT